MEKPIIEVYASELRELEGFLDSKDCNLCLVAGETGQGKSTLLKSLQIKKSHHPIIYSSFNSQLSDFYTSTVRGLTSLIIKHESALGYRWRHILSDSAVSMKTLSQLDSRLQPLLSNHPEQIDEVSDRLTILRRAVKELFLLCCQNLPFSLWWAIDSTENATDADLSFITDILEDQRSTEIKTILSISTSDIRTNSIALRLENIHHQFVYLEPLSNSQSRDFIQSYLSTGFDYNVDGIVDTSKGNIAKLITNSLDYDVSLLTNGRSDFSSSLEKVLRELPGGKLIASTAALMGMRFYSDDLHAVYSSKEKEVNAIINVLVNYSIINPFDDHYTFTTEENRAALIQTIPSTQRRYTKDKIAAFYYQLKENRFLDVRWARIAGYLYDGLGTSSTILTKTERLSIYLGAAIETAAVGDYSRANAYAKKAIVLVSREDWLDKKNILFPLYKLAAKSSYINDDIESMKTYTDVILCQADKMSGDYFDAYQILIEGYTTKNLLDEAITTANRALKMLDVRFPKRVGRIRAGYQILRLIFSIRKNKISSLQKSDDPKVQRVGRFLSFLAYAAYAKDENLSGYSIARGLSYTLKKGLLPETSYGLAFWSSGILAGFFKNIKAAVKHSNEAIHVSEITSPIYRSRITFLHNAFVGYHVEPIKDNVRALSRDIDNCLNDGVITFASYAAHVECFHDFDTDTPVEKIKTNIDRHIQNLQGYSRQNPDLWIRILRQLTADIGKPEFPPLANDGEYFSAVNDITNEVHEQNKAAIFIANHYEVVRHLLAGEPHKAQKSVNKSYKYMRYVRGTYGEILGLFANSAVIAYKSQHSRISIKERRKLCFTLHLFRHLSKQKSRVALAKLQAVEAIHYYCKGSTKKSLETLKKAIDISIDAGHTFDAIVLCRMAYDLFPDRDEVYLERAISLAEGWSAPAVESSLRNSLSTSAERLSYLNPKVTERNSLAYLIRCMDILGKSRSIDNKCVCISNELRHMLSAASCRWIPLSNDGICSVTGSDLDQIIKISFNDNRVIVHDDYEHKTMRQIIAPVQGTSVDYGLFLLQIGPDEIPSTNSLDVLKSVCTNLANAMYTTSQLSNMKYESTINNGLFENAAEGLLVATPDGQIRQFNKRLIEILDFPTHSNLMTINAIRESISINKVDEKKLDSFSKGIVDECQLRATTSSKRNILLSLKSDEKLVHCCISDITDTIRMSEKDEIMLQQARYFASAIHEIKNPLNTLLGYSNLSVQDSIESDEKAHFNRVINSSLLLLTDMFTDIISVSAITEGRFPIRNSRFHSKKVIDVIKKTYLENALLRGITISFNNESIENDELETDCDRIVQVVRNLVSNSIKYSECDQIVVSLSKENKILVISVVDNGIGIPEKSQEKLFDPYTRATGKDSEGSGLGLFICKKILDQIEGSIEYDTQIQGGAAFTIKIPNVIANIPCNEVMDSPLARKRSLPKGVRVMIVDDEPLNCSFIKRVLELHDVESKTFTNSEDAISYLDHDNDFNLLISDLHIGRKSGFDLIKAVKVRMPTRKCNYAILTGDSGREVNNRCSEEQIFYLAKPVNENLLLDLLRDSVEPKSSIPSSHM